LSGEGNRDGSGSIPTQSMESLMVQALRSLATKPVDGDSLSQSIVYVRVEAPAVASIKDV